MPSCQGSPTCSLPRLCAGATGSCATALHGSETTSACGTQPRELRSYLLARAPLPATPSLLTGSSSLRSVRFRPVRSNPSGFQAALADSRSARVLHALSVSHLFTLLVLALSKQTL